MDSEAGLSSDSGPLETFAERVKRILERSSRFYRGTAAFAGEDGPITHEARTFRCLKGPNRFSKGSNRFFLSFSS